MGEMYSWMVRSSEERCHEKEASEATGTEKNEKGGSEECSEREAECGCQWGCMGMRA